MWSMCSLYVWCGPCMTFMYDDLIWMLEMKNEDLIVIWILRAYIYIWILKTIISFHLYLICWNLLFTNLSLFFLLCCDRYDWCVVSSKTILGLLEDNMSMWSICVMWSMCDLHVWCYSCVAYMCDWSMYDLYVWCMIWMLEMKNKDLVVIWILRAYVYM